MKVVEAVWCRGGWRLRRLLETCGAAMMGVLYFAVLTPVGFVLWLAGRDRLRLRRGRTAATYWVSRGTPHGRWPAMNRQL